MNVWGLDASGSLQGAGGVGGLLSTYDAIAGTWAMPMYDAMGNVHGLINAADGSIVAAYEYDAFGNTLRESGTYAASNPYRYSTKYTDIETGLVYYGLRYYSPSLGKFINEDPIEEDGGSNLYGFCGNNGMNGYDLLGLDPDFSLYGPGGGYGNFDPYEPAGGGGSDWNVTITFGGGGSSSPLLPGGQSFYYGQSSFTVNGQTFYYNPVTKQYTKTKPGSIYQDPTGNYYPSTPTVTNPTTTNPNPTSTNPNPTTTNPNPTSTNPNPTTTNPNPTTTNPNPTTTNPNPTSTNPHAGPQQFFAPNSGSSIPLGHIDLGNGMTAVVVGGEPRILNGGSSLGTPVHVALANYRLTGNLKYLELARQLSGSGLFSSKAFELALADVYDDTGMREFAMQAYGMEGPAIAAAAGTIFFGQFKADNQTFHTEIKPDILSAVGQKNYRPTVGKNPDITVRGGQIILKGTGPFRGKEYPTTLDPRHFFQR
jgi:RHS repeat-associated protein